MLRNISTFTLFILLCFTSSAEPISGEEWDGKAFAIEDSRSYVGLAKILLSVSELTQEDGYLVGEYTLKVPLMKSKSDHGLIKLPLQDNTFDELKKNGGTLKGDALSNVVKGKINKIVCEIVPDEDQAVRLAITTGKRTINFVSRYTVIEKPVCNKG